MPDQEPHSVDTCAGNMGEDHKQGSQAALEIPSSNSLVPLESRFNDPALKMQSPPSSPFDVPEPLTEFTIFRSLPAELRLRIWNMAMPEERIIEVLWSKERGYFTPSRTPAILHACRESRSEALELLTAIEFDNQSQDKDIKTKTKSGEIGMASTTESPGHHNLSRFATYFNFDIDKLYLFRRNINARCYVSETDAFFNSLTPEVAGNIQSIIVCDFCFKFDLHPSTVVFPGARSLRSVSVVTDDPCWICYPFGMEVPYRPLAGHETRPLQDEPVQIWREVLEGGSVRCQESSSGMLNGPGFCEILLQEGSNANVVKQIEWFEVCILREES